MHLCFEENGIRHTIILMQRKFYQLQFMANFDIEKNILSIQNIIDNGVPPYKIILGVPTYGRSWSIKDPKQWMKMQPPVQAKGAAPAGFLTKAAGRQSNIYKIFQLVF